MNDQESLKRGMCGEVVGNGTHQMLVMAVEINRLQALVDDLPKCWRLVDGKLVQDCPVVPGIKIYWMYPTGSDGTEYCWASGSVRYVETMAPEDYRSLFVYPIKVETDNGKPNLRDCYSTREAVEAAEAERAAEMENKVEL